MERTESRGAESSGSCLLPAASSGDSRIPSTKAEKSIEPICLRPGEKESFRLLPESHPGGGPSFQPSHSPLICILNSQESLGSLKFKCLFSSSQVSRLSRQLLLADWGVEAQLSALGTRVLVVGAGGLGCPLALYLVTAGIGSLTIVDGDDVDESNLQRQIAHREADVGRNKSQSLREACLRRNSDASVIAVPEFLSLSNVLSLVETHDIIVDATDSRAVRLLLNDACVLRNKPLVCGSALRSEGQLATLNFQGGPCYRCIFPLADEDDSQSSFAASGAQRPCDEAGVLGPVPGLIGVALALEVLRLVRILSTETKRDWQTEHFEARLSRFQFKDSRRPWISFSLRPKQPRCIVRARVYARAVCGEKSIIKDLRPRPEYEDPRCVYPCVPLKRRISGETLLRRICEVNPLLTLPPLSTKALQLRRLLSECGGEESQSLLFLIDVRPKAQFQVSHLPYSLHFPLERILEYVQQRRKHRSADKEKMLPMEREDSNDEIREGLRDEAKLRDLEGCLFLQKLLGLPCPWLLPSVVCCVLICRRGKDSAVATEALHALINEGNDRSGSSESEDAEEKRNFLKIRFLNLHGGLEGMYLQGLSRMPVV